MTTGPSIPNVNLTNGDKETALHCAAQYGHVEVVELLLGAGAEPNIKNSKEETALDLAAQVYYESTTNQSKVKPIQRETNPKENRPKRNPTQREIDPMESPFKGKPTQREGDPKVNQPQEKPSRMETGPKGKPTKRETESGKPTKTPK